MKATPQPETGGAAPCRFEALREHKASQCPLCSPTSWMHQPGEDDATPGQSGT